MAICTVLFSKLYLILRKKRDQKARHSQFLFQNIQNETFEILKMLKKYMRAAGQPVELTQKLATEKTIPHSRYSYLVIIVVRYYAVITKGV